MYAVIDKHGPSKQVMENVVQEYRYISGYVQWAPLHPFDASITFYTVKLCSSLINHLKELINTASMVYHLYLSSE